MLTLLDHDYAALLNPPFKTLEHKASSDGWHDDSFRRTIRYRSDDLVLISRLVREGKALAYLPDYIIAGLGLQTLSITGCPYFCRQTVALVSLRSDENGKSWIDSIAVG